jgi:predicted amidohydrolase
MTSQTSRTFKAAVVQTLAVLGDVEANIQIVRRHTEEAVRQGAQLVVFPECMNSGYLFDSKAHCLEIAEPVGGRFFQAIAALCREHGLYIASGFTELGDDGRAYNSALFFGPDGTLIGHYQKQFLATHDQNWFEVGVKGNPVIETPLGRIGLLICFDGRIPEIARCLALQGAEVILDMANFFAMDQADMWVPARAYENGAWIVAATKAGVERSIYYPGGSLIVAPSGEVRARVANDTHGVATAEITLGDASAQAWSFGGGKLADRRPDAYALMAQPFVEAPLAAQLAQPLVPEQQTTKVAAIQAHAGADHDLDAALDMLCHAGRLGVKLMALPLHFGARQWALDGEQAEALARVTPGLVDRVHAIARTYGATIAVPTVVRDEEGLSPCTLLIGPDGVVGRQWQLHRGPRERSWAAPRHGGFEVFDTPLGRIGLVSGYDGMFPETVRVLALLGADLVLWACAWEHPLQRALLAVTKAEDSRVYVVCANRCDAPQPGGSFVIPPNGFPQWDVQVAAPPSPRWGAVMPSYANLALARQKRMIPGVDMLRNRLVQTYAVLTESTASGLPADKASPPPQA